MTLAPQRVIGPYEVRGIVGTGGMGEVYRAHDLRLDRDVALKVLPAESATDRLRLRRFEREARVVSQLNHPNIVTIYDIGDTASGLYIAMELVDGRTLRELLRGGPLPLDRLLLVAEQIASALACAHAAGIVHRDLKPENVMVSKGGAVKVLDFGLAKRLPFEGGADGSLETQTDQTEAGLILGTIGYMSPEQALGKPVHYGSDQFSLGSILYEMATGKRAFERPSKPETLSAIIREQPEPIQATNGAVPAPLTWIIERCLSKDPAGRYVATEDLAKDLNAVRVHLAELEAQGGALSGTRALRRQPAWRWAALAGALALIVSAALAMNRWRASVDPPVFRELTYRAGFVTSASFMPDESTVIYSAIWQGRPSELFIQRIGSPESRSLGIASKLFGLSTSGEMALSLQTRAFEPWVDVGTLARTELASGAAPREVLENVNWASWSPDGKTFAIVRESDGRSTLEYPIGTVLYRGAGFLSHPRVSRDGTRVAFLDHPVRFDDAGMVAVVDRRGDRRVLVDGLQSVYGLGWSPAGDEIWFTGTSNGTSRALQAVDLRGRRRVLSRVIGSMLLHDVSPSGKVLLTHDQRTQHVRGLARGETKERELSWLDYSLARAISLDGKTVLFVEGGEAEGPRYGVYVRGTDGSPAVRLGDGDAQALSSDARAALAIVRETDGVRIALYPTGAGEARQLPVSSLQLQRSDWMPDGKRLLLSASEAGHSTRLYLLDVAGGSPRPVSPDGYIAVTGTISSDGTRVVAVNPDHRPVIFSLLGGPPTPIKVNGVSPVGWTRDGTHLYVLLPLAPQPNDAPVGPRSIGILDTRTGTIVPWKTLGNEDGATAIHITPDGDAYVYSFVHEQGTLYVLEGLR
jgi:Tol biopolymer transport system component